MNRRSFLKAIAGAALAVIATPVLGASSVASPVKPVRTIAISDRRLLIEQMQARAKAAIIAEEDARVFEYLRAFA